MLNGLAPKGGFLVKLSSNLSNVVVPASVTVPAGALSATFKATTTAVSTQKVATVTAKLGTATESATITINPPTLVSLSLNPTAVVGGKTSTGTVTLSGPAPTGGMKVSLTSSAGAATVPASVTIPAGKTSATFTVKTTR
jgi:hypothetical protein